MQTNKAHWPSILILMVFGLGAAVLLLITFGSGIASLMDLFKNISDPAGEMIGAFAFGFELMVLLFCAWAVLQKAMGRKQADLPFIFPFETWQIFAVLTLMLLSIGIGGAVAYINVPWLAWFILPTLTLLVIVPPLWLLFGLGTNGIELGPRWRIFGMIGLSMTIAPAIMIILELILLLFIVIVGAVFIAIQQPALFRELVSISKMLQHETNPDIILNLVGPYLANPLVIATILGYIAILVPLIEELLKPLAVWIFATKIESPAQGFAMGVLSGGAFALIESLNASGDGSMNWPVLVSVRAGTSLLHMTASGLVGWGIVSAFREKRILRFFAAYLSAAAIHGVWNACAIGTGISSIGESLGKSEWLLRYTPALLSGMVVLGIGMFIVLIASNRKLIGAPPPQIERLEERVQ